MTDLASTQRRLLESLMIGAPWQPATNFWRCVELPVLAAALPIEGRGLDVGCGDGVLTEALVAAGIAKRIEPYERDLL